MKQILWFRRDLRIDDNAILANAKDKVLPIFIFDKNILSKLPKDDKRVSFLYKSVLKLKQNLKDIGLDLAIFHDTPENVFLKLRDKFDEILCTYEFDEYSIKTAEQISKILPLKRYINAFILDPTEHLKKDNKPYKVFTPFYKSLEFLTNSSKIACFARNEKLKKVSFDYDKFIILNELGFSKVSLPSFLEKDKKELFIEFASKINSYEKDRDFFSKNATSRFSVFLKFGLISPREIFNYFRDMKGSDCFIKELFWREFYNYLLYHFPKTQSENFKKLNVKFSQNEQVFKKWCEGKTGITIIDASMRHLNETGLMHNRLRMITASFLTKNLFIDWRLGEKYFAKKLLDYEICSNIGSWQWAASTGADSVPYFRVFNPYTQSKKFDKDAIFIKSVLKELKDINPKLLHTENGLKGISVKYPKPIVGIKLSRKLALQKFREAKNINLGI